MIGRRCSDRNHLLKESSHLASVSDYLLELTGFERAPPCYGQLSIHQRHALLPGSPTTSPLELN